MRSPSVQFSSFLFKKRETWHFRLTVPAPIRGHYWYVMLEFEWVMRGFYELSWEDIQNVFQSLCGLENVMITDRGIVLSTLTACQQGLDFADALHLARSGRCRAFLTFDQRLQKRAKVTGLIPIVECPVP